MITSRKAFCLDTKARCRSMARTRLDLIRPVPFVDAVVRVTACCSTGGGSGGSANGGTSEKPSNSALLEKSTSSLKKKPPTYKVMLHNDSFNKREKVVKVLMKVVDGMTMEGALGVMMEAHESGVAVVIACPQDEAETYCEQLRLNGLTSTIEA